MVMPIATPPSSTMEHSSSSSSSSSVLILYQLFSHAQSAAAAANSAQRNFREEEEGVVAAAAEGKEVLQAGNFTEDRLWPLREEEEAPVSSTSSSAAAAALRPPVISAEAKAIAILHHGTVTLLDHADNYKQPLGIFRAFGIAKGAHSRLQVWKSAAWPDEEFVHGVWLEELSMVAVASSQRRLLFLNVYAQEVDSLLLPDSKGSGAVAGVFASCTSVLEKGYEVVLLTSHGILHRVNKGEQIGSAALSPVEWSVKKQHPEGVTGLSFNAEHSVLAVVGPAQPQSKSSASTGGFSVSVWSMSETPMLLWCNLAMLAKPFLSQWWPSSSTKLSLATRPLARLSPNADCAVVIDGGGRLHLLTGKRGQMEEMDLGESSSTDNEGKKSDLSGCFLDGLEDAEWWSDKAVVVARCDGSVDLLRVPSLATLLDESLPRFHPGCLLKKGATGHIFVLDASSTRETEETQQQVGEVKKPNWFSWMMQRGAKQQQNLDRGWRLTSFVERSKSEMFEILIEQRDYEAALQLAHKYGLDVDQVYKARWRSSDFGKEGLHLSLAIVRDHKWVVKECMTRVCPSQDSMNSLLVFGLMETEPYVHSAETDDSNDDDDAWFFRLARLRLLQYKERLETFLGIHMGRFFPNEFAAFRSSDLHAVAVKYAEGGKMGSLDLLLKRHQYSLAPFLLSVLDAVPETIPPHSYGQLLPELTPPKAFLSRRIEDPIESRKTLDAIKGGVHKLEEEKHGIPLEGCTEHMVKLAQGLSWPSKVEISEWYKARARTIDRVSGQLENSLSLLDLGQRKGVKGLELLLEDTSDLIKVVLTRNGSEEGGTEVELSLDEWEQLGEYEKFQAVLQGAGVDSVVDRLREQAIPFLHRQYNRPSLSRVSPVRSGTSPVLGRWLKDMAQESKLDICATVFEEALNGPDGNGLFQEEAELVAVAIDCLYLCPALDQWSVMQSILSRFSPNVDSPVKESVGYSDEIPTRGRFRQGIVSRLRGSVSSRPAYSEHEDPSPKRASTNVNVGGARLRKAEAHVEAGGLLSLYQVARSMKFLANCEADAMETKQLVRILISKFSSRQPPRPDSEWTVMWHDLCTLQEKAFSSLNREDLHAEFCRGLLHAGKFSLAKNYVWSTGLLADKAEKLVLDAARDFFYSSPSIDSPSIAMAKQCLGLLLERKIIKAEADMIEAVTIKLPLLGVTLLPLQFRQVESRMEVVMMALTAQPDSYLNLPELMEVAKLLGLNSPDDIAAIEAAIAREAAAAGDFDLARDLCLGLVKKQHGAIWDLCVALGRGPELEGIDLKSRKVMLGFALAHCDEESVGELLSAWKDADFVHECHRLENVIGHHPQFIRTEPETLLASSSQGLRGSNDGGTMLVQEGQEEILLHSVMAPGQPSWDAIAAEQMKMANVVSLQVPWLLNLSSSTDQQDSEYEEEEPCYALARECSSSSSFAAALILYGLAGHGIVGSDQLVVKLAHEVLCSASKKGDKVGCGYLMNLGDAHLGAEVLEQEVVRRQVYEESVQAMKMAQLYAALQDAGQRSSDPHERRGLLLHSLSTLGSEREAETSHWTHQRVRTEEKLQMLAQARSLEKMIPGADFQRFADGDQDYINKRVLDLVGPAVKKTSLPEVLALASQYNVEKWQVLMKHMETLFLSEMATEDEIEACLQQHAHVLLERPQAVLVSLVSMVYSALDGTNKKRLHFFYQFIADCSSSLDKKNGEMGIVSTPTAQWVKYYGKERSAYWRTLAAECVQLTDSAEGLDFKQIAGLEGLNDSLAMEQIVQHANGANVSQLAAMIDSLQKFAEDSYFPSSEDVYMAFIRKVLSGTSVQVEVRTSDKELDEMYSLRERYAACCKYLDDLSVSNVLEVVESMLSASFSIGKNVVEEEVRLDVLQSLLSLWIQLFRDAELSITSRLHNNSKEQRHLENMKELQACCTTLLRLVKDKKVGGRQGWEIVAEITRSGVVSGSEGTSENFIESLVSQGCPIRVVVAIVDSLEMVGSDRRQIERLPERDEKLDENSTSTRRDEEEPDDVNCHGVDLGPGSSNRKLDLLGIYLQALEVALNGTTSDDDRQGIVAVLTSLGDPVDWVDMKDEDERGRKLQHNVQQQVWQRLSKFAHDLQVPLRLRIDVLELLEATRLGKLPRYKGVFTTWGSNWDSGSQQHGGGSWGGESFQSKSDLAALKSTELLSHLWPGRQVSSEDLVTAEAATCLFSSLLADATSMEHVLMLRSLLEEWDALFEPESGGAAASVQGNRPGETEEWGELEEWGGWEECSDELSVHVLHACWASTIERLALGGCIAEALQILDGALVHPSMPLVTQDEAQQLVAKVGARNVVSCLKIALLLPYPAPQTQALSQLEDELDGNSSPEMIEISKGGNDIESFDVKNSSANAVVDKEVVGLLLSSGLLPNVVGDAGLTSVFRALCEALTPLAQELQLHQLEIMQSSGLPEQSRSDREKDFPLFTFAFPLFVAELTRAKFYPVAGALVLQFMRVPPALATWNAAYAALKQYLEVQVESQKGAQKLSMSLDQGAQKLSMSLDQGAPQLLPYTMQNLSSRVKELPQAALDVLSKDMNKL